MIFVFQAIAAQDYWLVRFLVEHGADLSARCYGTFFNGPQFEDLDTTYMRQSYMGEYPASFAVAMGDADILRYLASKGANLICDRDSFGNYAAHIAVIHRRPEMLDLLYDELFHCGPVLEACRHDNRIVPLIDEYNACDSIAPKCASPFCTHLYDKKEGYCFCPTCPPLGDFIHNGYFNSNNLTPFMLAARMNNSVMFYVSRFFFRGMLAVS